MTTGKTVFGLAPDEPLVSYEEFVANAKRRSHIGIALSVILLVDGFLMWGSNMWTALITLLIGAVLLAVLAIAIPRLDRRDDVVKAGNVVVQHNWLLVSVGLAGLAIYPSPFFQVSEVLFGIAMVLCLALVIMGVDGLYRAISRTGARATI